MSIASDILPAGFTIGGAKMNWDAIGTLAEVAGAAGVIFSLLNLAVQIRHGSQRAEDTATREVFAAIGVQLSAMVEQTNPDVLLKGLVNYKSLPSREKFIFDGLMIGLVNMLEASFIANKVALISDTTMENWGCYLRPGKN